MAVCETTSSIYANKGKLSILVDELRGKAVTIPSLDDILADWPRGTNEGYQELRSVLARTFKQELDHPKKLEKLNRDDYALCGAGMYMNADFRGLEAMTVLTCWLFFFDDKVDHKDGELFDDETGFAALVQRASDYVCYALGLNPDYVEPEGGVEGFIQLFGPVGQALKALSEETRRTFLEDFQFYLRCLIQEQSEANRDSIRTFDDYMSIRRGTVCMYTICSAVQIASGVRLEGQTALPSATLKKLWTEIRDMMIYVNDLYSFRNEVYSENGASLVTLYLERGNSMEAVVSEVVSRITDCKTRFDHEASAVLDRFENNHRVALTRYFDSLKALVTGYHTWCLSTTRYNLKPSVRSDGSVVIAI